MLSSLYFLLHKRAFPPIFPLPSNLSDFSVSAYFYQLFKEEEEKKALKEDLKRRHAPTVSHLPIHLLPRVPRSPIILFDKVFIPPGVPLISSPPDRFPPDSSYLLLIGPSATSGVVCLFRAVSTLFNTSKAGRAPVRLPDCLFTIVFYTKSSKNLNFKRCIVIARQVTICKQRAGARRAKFVVHLYMHFSPVFDVFF